MRQDMTNAALPWATGAMNDSKQRVPQCIAHRGFRAKFPENSMLAFKEAIKVGAHGLETDVHITKDDVVVLSHDPTLQRCFGRNEKIIDKTWDQIRDLRSIAEPHVPLCRLQDLLEMLAEPSCAQTWVLLDIKVDNNQDDIMRLIASTIKAAPASQTAPWDKRIILGLWSMKSFPPAHLHCPSLPLVHIGISTTFARRFFKMPHVGFNMVLPMLMAPGGRSFIRDCQGKDRRLLIAWTVNQVSGMKWCIQKGLDGVVTDDPQMFLDVCRDPQKYSDDMGPRSLRSRIQMFLLWAVVTFLCLFMEPATMMGMVRRMVVAVRGIK